MSKRFEELVELQARLRAPGGCPWDREQTHESLRTYVLEEAYEVIDAIEAGDFERLPEELGDLLLQVVFHAQLAVEAGRFDIGEVIERIYTKLVRRHPHVFGASTPSGKGAAHAGTSAEVLKNWEELKAEERRASGTAPPAEASILDGVPRGLPALLEAYQLTRRAANVGFDWERIEELLAKLEEELGELRERLAEQRSGAATEEEAGDLLFVAVNIARFVGVDPELALRKANQKFSRRFRWMEAQLAGENRRLGETPMEEMEALWQRSKSAV